ncbi:cytochrome bd-I ubiquinol oxidase subunit 2 apoprotein [Streptomyces sp. DvalAA-14]|uniref:cytochrome d ubiquinol oxidase subunit II n=1 Tax=unclassified Streptomyces TaxID=2593676 RepID=UPI00081BB00C|nr:MULTISPECIES: cytochrome d ubiquinol oxidase subunit II [unclassified Streptomyces]MYS22279.1 cytochrome d ubiquinol oxidase subunit II [Streptomyces sp. SID4948]SCE12755.1 cytochrome bd-I ubiquinol oxidase subunit 2 apoprotein [Streptomyces sp. DvalAA-14]
MSDAVAALLFVGVVAYALFAGADFGAGFWDLTAGGARRGRRVRHLIDVSVGPVWEANHTWLIYCLVMLWTGFPSAFAAITTTLYIPLGLAVLGIVLRGSGFAFRKAAMRTAEQRLYGVAFATSSVLTPFCLGAVAGGVASGRVPSGGHGDAVTSWLNPTSVLGGVLAVVACAYLAAVFLTVDARHQGDRALEAGLRTRTLLAGAAAGVVSLAGVFVIHSDSPRLFHQLSHRGLGLVVVSALAGVVGLGLLALRKPFGERSLAALAVAAVVCGWGVAQYPFVLGTHLRISNAASPGPTLWVLIAVAGLAGLLIAPSLAYLYLLQNRGKLPTQA